MAALNDKNLLAPDSAKRIEDAVAQAEKLTSCELAVVLAPASSRYEVPIAQFAALLAIVFFIALDALNWFVLEQAFLDNPLWLMLAALAAGVLTALIGSRMQGVRQILIRRSTARNAVDLASAACFWEQKIGFTKQHNAILLYVSIAEGQARLLPDAGVTAKVPDAKFGELSQRLNAGEGDATDLVCGVIKEIGALVKEAFPRTADDVNEVPDKPVIRFP